jgi:hypothetical protein
VIKYHADIWRGIDPVEIERETEARVFLVGGRRRDKRATQEGYFDTWEAAHQFLMAYFEEKLTLARRQLERAQGAYGNVKGMKKPAKA